MISRNLDLFRGGHRFIKTAAYGHFGRDDPDFTCALPGNALSPPLCSASLSWRRSGAG